MRGTKWRRKNDVAGEPEQRSAPRGASRRTPSAPARRRRRSRCTRSRGCARRPTRAARCRSASRGWRCGPAKSFWKNGQLWRTTCQWLCQRIRLVTPGTTALLRTRLSASSASGRPMSDDGAPCRPASAAPRANAAARSVACISVTSLPMKTGIERVDQRDRKAGHEHRGVQAARLADEVPVEGEEAAAAAAPAGSARRADAGFEEGEHGVKRVIVTAGPPTRMHVAEVAATSPSADPRRLDGTMGQRSAMERRKRCFAVLSACSRRARCARRAAR